MTEREAIDKLRRGDISGLETLVRQHYVQAVRVAYLITQDTALAEDIVQSAFLRVYERIDQFDVGRPFAPWFLRSVVNDALMAERWKRHYSSGGPASEEEAILPSDDPTLDDLLMAAE